MRSRISSFYSIHARIGTSSKLNYTARILPTQQYCTISPRDTKEVFQEGNVKETITRWEKEANIAELNLMTEKLGIDRKKYKEVSVQMGDIIALRTRLLGNYHPETIYSNAILAGIYRVVGKHKAATNIITQCLSIIEELFKKASPKENLDELHFLYASCTEEFGRIFNERKIYEEAEKALENTISTVEKQKKNSNAPEFPLYLSLLQRVLSESLMHQEKYEEAEKALKKADELIKDIPDNIRLIFYLINHWNGKANAVFQNLILSGKLNARLGNFGEAEKSLQEAWQVAVANKGKFSIECCNAFMELLDFYSDYVPSQLSVDEYTDLLTQGLSVARSTDELLIQTRGLDKRIVYPYFQMVKRGLKTLLQTRGGRTTAITLLYECLRLHDEFPTIYPSTSEDLFAKVMTLVQLLREEGNHQNALDVVSKYKDGFLELKDKKPDYVVPLVEVQAQLIISACYGNRAPSPGGTIPLAKQMELTSQTREAVEGLEFVTDYYIKRKQKDASIKSLHTLAIVETLQEEYSYAERECFRCLRMISPSFNEYEGQVILDTEELPLSLVARAADVLILRGSLLRVQHEGHRAINHYKAALELLSMSRESLTNDKILKLKDNITRLSDILRCLDFMLDISKSTLNEFKASNQNEKLSEVESFIQACETQHQVALEELNSNHARLQRKQKKAATAQQEQQMKE